MLTAKITTIKATLAILFNSPKINISLFLNKTKDNVSFYREITQKYYLDAIRRHPKLPLFGTLTRGVAVCSLDKTYDEYFRDIESSGRRNVKKAIRKGYTFELISFNEHIDDIWEIRRSASVRQGKMPDELIQNRPSKINDPKSKTNFHDFQYYGVFNNEKKLVAYAGCFSAGEMIELSHYYGHDAFKSDGIVPLLITSIAQHTIKTKPHVKFYVYGGTLGASNTLKRFKKKFGFFPHTVNWNL